jgi:hypothetical protein
MRRRSMRFAKARPALIRPRFIVLAQPGIKIGLQLVERTTHLLERHPIELVERSLVEALAAENGPPLRKYDLQDVWKWPAHGADRLIDAR